MSEVFLRCIGCGGLVPAVTGPIHRYMETSPGCWQIYGEVLAREYSDPEFAAAHGRAVDDLCSATSGQLSPQSVWKTEGASAHVQRVRGGQSPPGRLGSQHHDQIEEWVPEHLRRGL